MTQPAEPFSESQPSLLRCNRAWRIHGRAEHAVQGLWADVLPAMVACLPPATSLSFVLRRGGGMPAVARLQLSATAVSRNEAATQLEEAEATLAPLLHGGELDMCGIEPVATCAGSPLQPIVPATVVVPLPAWLLDQRHAGLRGRYRGVALTAELPRARLTLETGLHALDFLNQPVEIHINMESLRLDAELQTAIRTIKVMEAGPSRAVLVGWQTAGAGMRTNTAWRSAVPLPMTCQMLLCRAVHGTVPAALAADDDFLDLAGAISAERALVWLAPDAAAQLLAPTRSPGNHSRKTLTP